MSLDDSLDDLNDNSLEIMGILSVLDSDKINSGVVYFNSLRAGNIPGIPAALLTITGDHKKAHKDYNGLVSFGVNEVTAAILTLMAYPNSTLQRHRTDDKRGFDFYKDNFQSLLLYISYGNTFR